MSKRDDMIAAMSGRLPGRVPLWELEFQMWNQFSDEKLIVGTPFTKLTGREQQEQLDRNARIICDVSERLDFAGITLPAWYWESAPGEPAYFWLPEPDRETLLRRIIDIAGDRFYYVVHVGGVLGMPPSDRYMEFSCQLFEDPESIDRRARENCDEARRRVEHWAPLGADGFLMPADQAMNNGPFYNPEQMDRFIYPYLREMADTIRQAGGHSILHTDGNVMPLMDGYMECGIDAIQALDPIAGMDLEKVKAKTGDRLTLCGNVDCCTLISGTPGDVAEQTRECLARGKPGGRFVLGASNAVEYSAPAENFQAMIDTWRADPGYDA
ncbi:uroporphyrinogen decarboxylase family protein [Kiritimatiella glycovorans]|uniref:Methylcobalamin methyltransferase n=1 Tax=Kiritimatiella glycovorans TaxID=1307763 RepID=A0A0G3EJ39_9BACT|nr:uroporphyrinogen decarboxylase family protein [Kiritimatiella glycovorans]AKJ64204.1 methylcobalamin methyltransferase [Kiritimatiella glycovorans]